MRTYMKQVLCALLFTLPSINALAQYDEGPVAVNISFLPSAIKGTFETRNVDAMYAYFTPESMQDKKTRKVYEKLYAAEEEFFAKAELGEDLSGGDDAIREAQEALADPTLPAEIKKQLEESIKLAKKQRDELKANSEFTLSFDPKELLEEAKKVSLGGRLYTGHAKLSNGNIMLAIGKYKTNAERQGQNGYDKEFIPEEVAYTWGMLNGNGEIILPFEYRYHTHSNKPDIIFLTHKEKNGTTKAGIVDFEGKEVFPFKFKEWHEIFHWCDHASFVDTNGKIGLMDFEGKVYYAGIFDELREDGQGEHWFHVLHNGKRKRIFYETETRELR